MTTLTYGNLPTFEEFQTAFEQLCLEGMYKIRLGKSDSRAVKGFKLGDGYWDAKHLYEALSQIVYVGTDDAKNLASSILETLGFEWV